MPRFKMKSTLTFAYLIFPTWLGGRYHHLHFTAQNLTLSSEEQPAQSQEDCRRQGSGPCPSAPVCCALVRPQGSDFELFHSG